MNAEELPSGWPDGLMRLLRITWPKPTGYPPHPAEIQLHDHDTGRQIVSGLDMVLTATAGNAPITAELTMLIGGDGLPLIGEKLRATCDEDGQPRTAVFRWVVAEMRIADE